MGTQDSIAALQRQIGVAIQAGRDNEAGQLWQRLLDTDPDNTKALFALSQRAFRAGDLGRARELLGRLVALDGRDQQQWINLAVVCRGLHDDAGEAEALTGALTVDPTDMLAQLLRGDLFERQGRRHEAARAYGAGAMAAPPLEGLDPSLRPLLQRALAFQQDYQRDYGDWMEAHLAPLLGDLRGEPLGRFRDAVDIMFGRKRRYDPQPALFYYPGLAPVTFFERGLFPWMPALEARTDAIRAEFLAVLQAQQGFVPYLSYPPDQPHFQFAQLNNSPDWSAFHLIEQGRTNEANAAHCPVTMAALADLPQPRQLNRTPSAMFSLLRPHTRIPAHTGVSNVRLVGHLPLILPGQCALRVGNDVREWEMNRAWVFDDTIEHEAWNDSDALRVVLIFDVWHPHLSPAERTMITALADGIAQYGAAAGGFEL